MSSTAVMPEAVQEGTRYGVIDTDVHPSFNTQRATLLERLPKEVREYAAEYGLLRPGNPGGDRPRHREFASRWDTEPPGGGEPMSNPDYAREQLLDKFDISAAILNDIAGVIFNGSRSTPRHVAEAVCRALNQERADIWFEHDERWYGSINAPYEVPERAVKEIIRCKEDPRYGDRWRQVMFAPDNTVPPGNEKYYPIYEVCEEYDLPVGMHVLASHRITASGSPNFYFEEHCDWAAYNFPNVASLIFEGTFDRFPKLKFAFVELAWSWAVPLGWRLDRAYDLMRSEVPHLQKRPSEYLRDHFWFSTQPMEEPENPAHFAELLHAFESFGMADKLMYSSDYPHWDFDEPSALPQDLSDEQRRRILGENASKLYGLEIKADSGVILP